MPSHVLDQISEITHWFKIHIFTPTESYSMSAYTCNCGNLKVVTGKQKCACVITSSSKIHFNLISFRKIDFQRNYSVIILTIITWLAYMLRNLTCSRMVLKVSDHMCICVFLWQWHWDSLTSLATNPRTGPNRTNICTDWLWHAACALRFTAFWPEKTCVYLLPSLPEYLINAQGIPI